jgi:hypothetical protein
MIKGTANVASPLASNAVDHNPRDLDRESGIVPERRGTLNCSRISLRNWAQNILKTSARKLWKSPVEPGQKLKPLLSLCRVYVSLD